MCVFWIHVGTEALGDALICFIFIYFFYLIFFQKKILGTEALGGALAWLRAKRPRSSPFVHEKLRPGLFFNYKKKLKKIHEDIFW